MWKVNVGGVLRCRGKRLDRFKYYVQGGEVTLMSRDDIISTFGVDPKYAPGQTILIPRGYKQLVGSKRPPQTPRRR